MNCPICNKNLPDGICPVCGYTIVKEKQTLLKKIFGKKEHNLPYSEEINKIISFLKWNYFLFNENKYISRKEVNQRLEEEKANVEFFNKMCLSSDIETYLKKYSFSFANVKKYIDINYSFFDVLKERNNNYVNEQLVINKDYFDNILKECDPKLKLDDDQRKVILTDEDYNIVIAGAGAGKTTTVAAKVKYLVDKQHIDPKDILIISFTNKAVNELKERINGQLNIPCPIATFHSAGRAILLKDVDSKNTQIERENFFPILNYLTMLVSEDKELLSKLVLMFSYYLDVPEEELKNLSNDELFDYKQKKDYTTLKSNLNEINQSIINSRTKEQKTIKNELLRSVQEVQIANFLYLHNLDYEYEKPYKYNIPNSRKIYTPDFFIKQGDKECYLEHFGITEDLKHDRYTKEELDNYIINMKYKISHHQTFDTNLIKTYSKYNDGRPLLEHLEEELIKQGFILKRKEDEEIYNKIMVLDKEKYVFRFAMLASRFIHLFKTRDFHEEDFSILKSKTNNPRNLLFLNILEKVYLYYERYLREKQAVDFEDMINESTRLLKNVKNVQNEINFKYVIVDEYQDISRQRFNLVKTISEICNAKICVVGDDWQSIYAFSGSEINLFTRFKEEMGYAEELKIVKTYRNSQELIDIAGKFIQKNSSQITKSLKSNKSIKKPVVVFTYSDIYKNNEKPGINGVNYEKAKLLEEVLGKIIQVDGENSNILLIGRYSFDGDQLCKTGLFYNVGKTNSIKSVKYKNLKLTFMTAHSSKGLTYDNVIILNAIHSRYGFPSQIEDDPVLKFVMYEDKSYEFAEERRLFYVALTRTKNRVFILAPQTRPSKFVLELINEYDNISVHGEIEQEVKDLRKNKLSCPKCGYPLQLKESKAYGLKLYICTNEPEMCDFMTNEMKCPGTIYCCDKCDGYMIVKKKKDENHYFMGCTNYKQNGKGCNHIEQIERD